MHNCRASAITANSELIEMHGEHKHEILVEKN